MRATSSSVEEFLSLRGYVSLKDVADRFGVSEVTARRYLKRFEGREGIRLVPGGAVIEPGPPGNPLGQGVLEGLEKHRDEKAAIAAFAVSLIEIGETLFIDSGSTCYHAARRLPENRNLTVITHSLDIAAAAKDKRGIRVICPGGEVDAVLNIMTGTLTERHLESFHAARCFLGAGSIRCDRGTLESTLVEVAIKNILNRNADESYILAGSAKFARYANFAAIPIEAMRTVVTSNLVDADARACLEARGVEVLAAPDTVDPQDDAPTARFGSRAIRQ